MRALAAVFLSMLIMGVASLLISLSVVKSSERKWCSILAELEAPDQPATTPRGAKIARELHKLREDYRC